LRLGWPATAARLIIGWRGRGRPGIAGGHGNWRIDHSGQAGQCLIARSLGCLALFAFGEHCRPRSGQCLLDLSQAGFGMLRGFVTRQAFVGQLGLKIAYRRLCFRKQTFCLFPGSGLHLGCLPGSLQLVAATGLIRSMGSVNNSNRNITIAHEAAPLSERIRGASRNWRFSGTRRRSIEA
jgi:hypothetical protein